MKILKATALATLLLAVNAAMSVSEGQDFDKGMSALNRLDYAAGWRELRPLAERGHAGAQLQIGEMYFRGLGIPKNSVMALKWIIIAATQR